VFLIGEISSVAKWVVGEKANQGLQTC